VISFWRKLTTLRKLTGVLIGIEYVGYFLARTFLTEHTVGVTGWPMWVELLTGVGLAYGAFNFEPELLSPFMSNRQISIVGKPFQILGIICGTTMAIAGWMLICRFDELRLR
jgi:hypothetical protein